MKKLIFYFIVLVAATWLGIIMHKNPGYVLVAYQTWTLETTLWFALIAILVAFLVINLLVKFLRGTFHLSKNIRDWSHKKRLAKSLLASKEGLTSFLLGRWKQAEKQLKNGTKNNPAAYNNYLLAAYSAQFQNKTKQRERYFNRMKHKANKEELLGVIIAEAKLLLVEQKPQEALDKLSLINKEDMEKTPSVVILLQKIYVQLQYWQALYDLLPYIKKHDPMHYEQTIIVAYQGMIKTIAAKNDFKALTNFWQSLPKDLQNNSTLVGTCSAYLIKFGNLALAEQLIKKALKANWDEELVRLYGFTTAPNPNKQLSEAESWLKTHPHDANLLYTLGRLAAKNRLWGKAKHYLEQSNKIKPQAQTYFWLGRVSEQLGEVHIALNYYRTGLQLDTLA